MKKIRFIKENDLFDWEVGEVREVRGKYVTEPMNMLIAKATPIHAEFLVETGYAEWVEDSLVDQVDKLTEDFKKENGMYHCNKNCQFEDCDKYIAMKMYDAIVKELNGDWKPIWKDGVNQDQNNKWVVSYRDYFEVVIESLYREALHPAKSEEICQAMIDSKKMRPYLNKILGS